MTSTFTQFEYYYFVPKGTMILYLNFSINISSLKGVEKANKLQRFISEFFYKYFIPEGMKKTIKSALYL
jgi:hypothetical protein